MILPNAQEYNKDTMYLRSLIDKIGLSQRATARLIGVNESTLRGYLNPHYASVHPYPVQYCLEILANQQLVDIELNKIAE